MYRVIIFFAAIMFSFCLLSNKTIAAEHVQSETTLYPYTIFEVLGGYRAAVTNGSYEFIINVSSDCYFYSSDNGSVVYIESSLFPGYGNTVEFDGDYCEINNFPTALNLNGFFVTDIGYTSSYITGITAYGSKYLIEYGYGCSAYDFSLYDYTYFDSYDSVPSAYYDDLYALGYYREHNCNITNVIYLGYIDLGQEDTTIVDNNISYLLSIKKIAVNAPGKDIDNLRLEYITLQNVAGYTLNTRKWKIKNAEGLISYLPKTKLGKNGTIKIITGNGNDQLKKGKNKIVYLDRKKEFFNNDHDTIQILDNNNQVIFQYQY